MTDPDPKFKVQKDSYRDSIFEYLFRQITKDDLAERLNELAPNEDETEEEADTSSLSQLDKLRQFRKESK